MNKITSDKTSSVTSKKQSANTHKGQKQSRTNSSKHNLEEPLAGLKAESVQKKLKSRIRELNPQTDEEFRKARKIILETCVLWEFGDTTINDPKLPEILKAIEQKIATNTEIQEHYDSFIKGLL